MTKPLFFESPEAIFETQVPLNEVIKVAIREKWNVSKTLARHEFLSEKGKIEQHLYFVRRGELRIYYPTLEGEEICVGFGYEGTLITSYPSFIAQKPAQYYIQSITPCELIGIKQRDFVQLIDTFRALERAWRKLTEEALLGKIERETEMLTFTPEERLERLSERSPFIFNKIPQKYLASYLRMTPETFSRMKNKTRPKRSGKSLA